MHWPQELINNWPAWVYKILHGRLHIGAIGPFRIVQLIPQTFSGVTEVKFITPMNSPSILLLQNMAWSFLSGTRQGGVIFSLASRLLDPQKLFGVIGGAMITLINSWKIKWGSVIQAVPMVFSRQDRVRVQNPACSMLIKDWAKVAKPEQKQDPCSNCQRPPCRRLLAVPE